MARHQPLDGFVGIEESIRAKQKWQTCSDREERDDE